MGRVLTTATSCGPDKMPFDLAIDLTGATQQQVDQRIIEAVRITVHRKVNAMPTAEREAFRKGTLTVGIDGNKVLTAADREAAFVAQGIRPELAAIFADDPDALIAALNDTDVKKVEHKLRKGQKAA